jgi:hypothetical protein
MDKRILPQIDDRLRTYESEHRGEHPLYIIMPKQEAEQLIEEVRSAEGHDDKVVVTEYKGSKILKHEALKAGEVRLTNELPDTSS